MNLLCIRMNLDENNIYGRQVFTACCDLKPAEINRKMYETLEKKIKKKFSGVCIPALGYIKPGSVEIVSKEPGKHEGSHFTGNMTFHVKVAAMVTMPMKGQIINALVVSKHDTGVVAKNYSFPYTLFVPKMPNESTNVIDRIEKNSYIRVEVLDSELNPPDMDTPRAEYWVVCRIDSIDVEDIKRLELPAPQADNWPVMQVKTSDYSDIDQDRESLTNEAYGQLQEAKNNIGQINSMYSSFLAQSDENTVNNDLVVQDKISHYGTCAVAYVEKLLNEEGRRMRYQVKVLAVKGDQYKVNVQYVVELEKKIDPGSIIVLSYDIRGNLRSESIEFWSDHVKYIVNPYENIRISGAYAWQLRRCGFTPPPRDNTVSRAYYKMVELFRQIVQPRNMKVACIAESPGGFIQALIEKRTRNARGVVFTDPHWDNISAISIPIDTDKVWDKVDKKLRELDAGLDSINIINIKDVVPEQIPPNEMNQTILQLFPAERGDILVRANRDLFYRCFASDKADLVTADGGFERDKSASDTEELDTFRLLVAETIMALRIQAHGGCFLLKIYDMATYSTVGLLSLLSYCYQHVYVYKPRTSRNASSEKYVVCRNFMSHTVDLDRIIESLEQIIDMPQEPAQEPAEEKKYISHIIAKDDDQIINSLRQYNSIFMQKQGGFIHQGKDYALKYLANKGVPKNLQSVMNPYVNTQIQERDTFMEEYVGK